MTHSLSFSDGKSIPQLGLGVWQIPDADTANIVATAINTGYRLIDGAFIYENESGMGEGIRRADVARDELFVTSKVWNSEQGYDKTRRAIEGSLKRIGLEQLDLCLIHWPCPAKNMYVETWNAFIDAQKDGQLKSIGVSNFDADHLDRIIHETGVAPVLNQIEINPRMQQAGMIAENRKRNIVTQSWTPLGEGKSFNSDVLQEIATRLGRTVVQIILRWHLQLGLSVIPRTSKVKHLTQNLQVWDFELTSDDLKRIATLDEGVRCGPAPSSFEVE